ncbi:hypothetical protein [Dysgonomonas sp. BGC7]|uniref:hypothetical protein n=1 Tax=Dysgonomonas sp. BGC7 TaxID=1658008 RepID=UPI000680436D|nr:hypothetical protein [Dysgonomonas sp. BGC7]MBD8389173.1 hypothetical protein [Dysgonomonas sp. BGC7]
MTTKKSNKPIFSRNDEIDKMAFMSWRMGLGQINNTINLAEGYFESAIVQTESCLQDNEWKRADILIFPMLMCLNHGIELYLKASISIYNELLNNNLKVDGTHNLSQLYTTLKARIKDLDGQKASNEFEKNFKVLSDYIDELISKIQTSPNNDKMDFSRYSFGKKGESHFYVDRLSTNEIDLENLLSIMNIMFEKFDAYTEYLYYDKLQQGE